MLLYKRLLNGEELLSVLGLGYVGISTAVAFSKKVRVIGFDLDKEKIKLYKRGIDPSYSVGNKNIKNSIIEFTDDETMLKKAKFHIVAVPTPIRTDNTPDLSMIKNACEILGRNLSSGSIVVIESTVYPGMTREICIPILEKASGLICGRDFKVGYSPERINPGDKIHRFENIVKIVSGMDESTLEEIAGAYELVVEVGVYRAQTIEIAEAAKAVENAQRDINIAFMNELSIIFDSMRIDTKCVLEAASTKWNFMNFYPGLVGGQCISVDPYYLIYEAKRRGYESKVMSAGREINDYMATYISEKLVSLLSENIDSGSVRVAILGATFKENFPDVRKSKVLDVVSALKSHGYECFIYDPVAVFDDVRDYYGTSMCSKDDIKEMDAVVFAVAHDEFKTYTVTEIDRFFGGKKKIIADIKGIFKKEDFESAGYIYWRL